MKKKPRFFCDNCGAAVDRDAAACPNCGRFFASVRCPACGFAGEERLFAAGCPACGYSSPSAGNAASAKLREEKEPAPSLPLWVYIISIIAFCAVVVFLFTKVMK